MKLPPALVIALLISLSEAYGQHSVIRGASEDYADQALFLRKVTNPILGTTRIIDTLVFNRNGEFNAEVDSTDKGWILLKSGIFEMRIYVEPGSEYDVILPPRTDKTEADIRNPFFQPASIHLRVEREYNGAGKRNCDPGNDINTRIFIFDTLLEASNYKMLTEGKNNRKVNSDSIIRAIEADYSEDSSAYFRKYRRFRYGLLKINSRDEGLEKLYSNYLESDRPLTSDPAYMDLFNQMYDEFLFYFSRTPDGDGLVQLVNRYQDLEGLKNTLMKHAAIPDRKLCELILVKEIFDSYSTDYFYREALIILLDSIMKHPEDPEFGRYAGEVKKYLTRLSLGAEPPDFELPDQHGKVKKPADFRGKYTYLYFCTPDNYGCLKEYPFLDVLQRNHSDHLQIVTVMVTESLMLMQDFMKRNRYHWTALFYSNDDELLKDYSVRAYPTAYLLNPEGIIIQSPAVLATEGFEQQLFRIMKARGDL